MAIVYTVIIMIIIFVKRYIHFEEMIKVLRVFMKNVNYNLVDVNCNTEYMNNITKSKTEYIKKIS